MTSLKSMILISINAGVAKLADAPDLGSGGATRGGSSPSTRTTNNYEERQKLCKLLNWLMKN